MRDPQVTMGKKMQNYAKMVIHDLDDLGYPHWLETSIYTCNLWCHQTKAKFVNITPTTMVYATQKTIVLMGLINQLTNL